MRRAFNWMNGARNLNTIINTSTVYSRETLSNLLRKTGLPCSQYYMAELERQKLIVKQSLGRYRFTQTPIHYMEFERCLRLVRNARNQRVSQPVASDDITAAIQLLKAHNYLVFKQL